MISFFKLPPLAARLRLERDAVRESRVAATARVSYWKNQEAFLLSEDARLSKELAELETPAAARKPQAVEK